MITLRHGDTIGIISPSWVANKKDYENYTRGIEELGFQVKLGKNIYKDTYRFTASVKERVDDLNEMIYDETVKMIFFGGGYGSIDLLPYIDFDEIKKNPKLFLSYSDGTSILDAIYAQTGITTYYGQTPGLYDHVSNYDKQQFLSHFAEGNVTNYISNSNWHTLTSGYCRGHLIGGYLFNFVLSLGNKFFPYPLNQDYILFIEESEKYQSVQDVSMLLSCIEQNPLMERVKGLLFGHYSDDTPLFLFEVLERFGQNHHIPIAYCDDFGHGTNHAIFPVGIEAHLDTQGQTLSFIR